MADNSFKIVARLDIPASMPVIKDDIKSLSEQLKSDKNARAKIVAGLDIAKSKSLIQSQLATITNQANAPTIKVGVDIAGVNGNNLKPEIKPILDRTAFKDIESYINAIAGKLSQVKIADPSSIVKNIKDSLGVNSPEVKNAVIELVNALKLTPNNKAAIVDSYQNLIESIRGTIDSSKIVNDKNFEKNLADEIYRSATAFKDVQTQAQQTSSSVVNNLQQVQAQATQTGNAMSSAFGVGHFGKQANEYVHSQHQIRTTFDDTLNVVKEAEAYFQKFGTVSVDSVEQLGRNGALKQFTVNVESATGAVEKFKYIATNIGDNQNPVKIFELQNVDASNAGIQRLVKSTEEAKVKYSRLLADFKSSNSAIQSGLTAPIAEFERVLNGLGKTSSISDVKNAFESLKKSASEITTYLDTTNSSFNKSTNAINNYKNMDNILKEMSTSFDNLTIKPNNLKTELDGVKTKLAELQNLEKTEGGYTKAWAEKYREVNLELSRVKANIELAAKAESKSQKADKNSAYQTQLKYLNKIKEETNTIISLKRKMVNAGTEENAVYQHEITKAQKRIQYDVQQLQKKKLLTDEAQRLVNTYKEEIALQDRINSAKSSDKAIQQRIADMKAYQKQIETAISSLTTLNNSTVFSNNSSNPQVTQTKQELVSLRTEYQQLLTQLQANPTSQGLETLRTKLTELDNRMKTAVNSAKVFEKQLRSDNSADQLAKKVNVLSQQMKAYQATNTKAAKAYKQQFSDMFAILSNPNIDNQAFTTVQKQFQALRQEAIATGKVGKTMFQTIGDAVKKFAGWMSMTYLVSSFARSLREMVNNVIELDSAMTNLKKVTDETEATYSKFLKSVSKQAKELHSTMTDLIEQTSEWAKLGYDLNQANQLSKASMIYANVGEVDNEQAVTNIVSAMKAFDIAVNDVMSIPDVYNKLGNEFAVSSKNLGSSMSQAATTMAMAGNDFNQVAAILTGAGEILGDNKLDEIGNGMKTVTLRIQNQAGALKELGEEYEDLISVSKTQQQVYELTGGAVNIMSESDPNTFRSTYDILKDVANVIDDMNDTEASELVQLLFGKNRANVGTAVLKAFQSGQIEKAYEAAVNSAGSAQKEFDAWSESIEAHINTFKASWESLSQTIVDSKSIKSIIDFGTTILNTLDSIIEKFGTIPTLLTSITAVGAFKNVGGTNKTRPFLYSHNFICIENETRFKIRLSNCWDDYAKAL